MSHLTDLELVDVLDASLSPARARHLDDCIDCRRRAEDLRVVVMRVADTDVPEPSPLFWDHFSARVRTAISGDAGFESTPSRWAWLRRPAVAWAFSAAMLVVAVVTMTTLRRPGENRAASIPSDTAPVASASGVDVVSADADVDSVDVDHDVAWSLVRTVADEVSWDDVVAAGSGTPPGSMETAVRSLTDAERAELIALLTAESKRPGA